MPGFATEYVPLHHYLLEALNRVFDHLQDGDALPPSQAIRPRPRPTAGRLSRWTPAADRAGPDEGDRIFFTGDAVVIPE